MSKDSFFVYLYMQKILFLILFNSFLLSDIFNVPSDQYPTIQSGIDVAQDGDTVLVSQGTYYENLQITRSITLASHAIYDDLTNWVIETTPYSWEVNNQNINSTIIDGSNITDDNYGSTILIFSNEGDCILPMIKGFTIQNGIGTLVTRNNVIYQDPEQRLGGGLLFDPFSNPIIEYNLFKNNGKSLDGITQAHSGGAIYATTSDEDWDFNNRDRNRSTCDEIINDLEFDFSNNYFDRNDALIGRTLANKYFDNTFNMSSSIFDAADCSQDQISLVWVNIEEEASLSLNDIGYNNCGNTANNVYVDVNISEECIVSGCGSESNPYKTITWAIQMIFPSQVNHVTLHLKDGIYSPDSGEVFWLPIPKHTSVQGESMELTIIDAMKTSRVMKITDAIDCSISNLTVTGGSTHSFPGLYGGGIYSINSTVDYKNIKIIDNQSNSGGGGIFALGGNNINLNNVIIHGNYCESDDGTNYVIGGGIGIIGINSSSLINVTITNNSDQGIYANFTNNMQIINSIIWNHRGGAIEFDNFSNITVDYSNIDDPFWDEGNINTEPSFVNILDGNLNLSENSPCIDSGIADIDADGIDDIIDFYGTAPDMGAIEHFCESNIYDQCGVCNGDNQDCTGCTDYNAINYNPSDIFDDESCFYNLYQDIWVDPVNGDNLNSGINQDSPFKSLSHAMYVIASPASGFHTIHLSEGTYSPSSNGEVFPIYLKNNIHIEGENEINTILDAQESATVIKIDNTTNNTISNITVTGGLTGIFCLDSSPSLRNMTISNNIWGSFYHQGSGLRLIDANPELESVTITNNFGEYGGGIYALNSDAVFTDVLIDENTSYNHGGGVYCNKSSNLNLTDVIISNNSTMLSQSKGGGIYIESIHDVDESFVSLTNANIIYNVSYYGGGIYNHSKGNLYLSNVIIDSNVVAFMGGGIYSKGGVDINNVEISNNVAESGGGAYIKNTSVYIDLDVYIDLVSISNNFAENKGGGLFLKNINATFSNIIVYNNYANDEGGGISIEDGAPILSDVIIRGNEVIEEFGYGGGIYVENSSPQFYNILVDDNEVTNHGGGIYSHGSAIQFINVIIKNNSAVERGGGMYFHDNSTINFNSGLLVYNNESKIGAGIGVSGQSDINLYNATIVSNKIIDQSDWAGYGAGIWVFFADVTLKNSIVYNNRRFNSDSPNYNLGTYFGDQIEFDISYSNIEGIEDDNPTIYQGDGIISEDPQFINEDLENYNLQETSPCIDTGTTDFDQDGIDDITEFIGAAPDMGAFEFEFEILFGDLNQNQYLNIYDIIILVEYALDGEYVYYGDVNQDGIVDVIDVVALVSLILDF